MKSLLSIVFRNPLARDYLVVGVVICALAVVGVHLVANVASSVQQSVRVQQAQLSVPRDEVRNYQISRSVLDDTVITGSIGKEQAGRPIILDPCTGKIKGN